MHTNDILETENVLNVINLIENELGNQNKCNAEIRKWCFIVLFCILHTLF